MNGPLHARSSTSPSRRVAWYWHFVDVVWLRPVHLRVLAVGQGEAQDKTGLPPGGALFLGQR
ncbi:MAG: hypothetical protein MZV65_20550 [Chromatiales bacterium]|nr:hypothetical protein [Chromatiales bacterium]